MILVIGWLLLGFAFVCAAVIGVLALAEGQAVPVAHVLAGRPSMFVPGAHIPVVIVGIVVSIIFFVRKLLSIVRRKRSNKDDERTERLLS